MACARSQSLVRRYKGHDEVVGFFTKSMELSSETLRIDVDEILTEGERAVVLCTVSAERNGQAWSSPEVHVWRLVVTWPVDMSTPAGKGRSQVAYQQGGNMLTHRPSRTLAAGVIGGAAFSGA